ncbi:PaaI family thioesterase [Protofrankia sp. BMG5.30]|uniref:PaaI family thioesterase n=1 Tax=Protofrankia TaxID=2994361 RepID=UPI00352AE5A4
MTAPDRGSADSTRHGPADGSADDHVIVADPSDRVAVLEAVNARRGELAERMGLTIVEASAERVVATMPVAGNRQPYGLLHGGASVVLAETIGSIGAMLNAGPTRAAVGIEINATHHRAASSGTVTGVATRAHASRALATFDIRITDDSGRLVCTSRLTCMLRDRIPAGGSVPASTGNGDSGRRQ